MFEQLHDAISHHFTHQRIVLWYDDNASHRDVFEAFRKDDIEKIEIVNNELSIKYRVLKTNPDQKFLIYSPTERPRDSENWLLDLALSQFVFASDRSALTQNALGLSDAFRPVIREHLAFFDNTRDRLEPLTALIEPRDETSSSLQLKMLSIIVARSAAGRRRVHDFGEILLALAEESFEPHRPMWESVEKFGLAGEFFRRAKSFGYAAEQPSVQGFTLSLFESVLALQGARSNDPEQRKAHVLVSTWENALDSQSAYHTLVSHVQNELGIESRLRETPLSTLLRITIAPIVDWIIAHRIAELIVAGTYDTDEIRRAIAARKNGYWPSRGAPTLQDVYGFLEHVVELESAIAGIAWRFGSADEVWHEYTTRLFRIDFRYREAIRLYQKCDSPGFLNPVVEKLNDRYVGQFLQRICEHWDTVRPDSFGDALKNVARQSEFFDRVIAPYLNAGRRVVVIVSDGLRYETGQELAESLRAVNRFEVEIEPMVASLPSFTQLGMNSLLPHSEITLTIEGKVLVDGKNLASLDQRGAHLKRETERRFNGKRALAVAADDFSKLPKQTAREELEDVDLLYLYCNHIDAVGDNLKTERSVTDAAHREVGFIVELCRKVANSLNRTHIVITADHGFLYQDSKVDDLHLLAATGTGATTRVERRYMLSEEPVTLDHISERPPEGYGGNVRVSFPEGLYRIRKQGGGVRYVHGGSSLQEICIPLIRLQKARIDDVSQVGVQILVSPNRVITTGAFAVNFFQDRPVDAKNAPRTINAYFAADDNTVISDTHRITFDSADNKDQNRGRRCLFHFTPDAARYNGKPVTLVLEDIRESGHAVPYARESYTYRTMGELDF